MSRSYVASAIAGAFVFGLATAAIAATQGEFNNLCVMGLAGHKIMHTDCSVNTSYKGKTYCFSNKQDKAAFLKNPSANVTKAESFYKKHPQG
jgi:YHS domain-containing protein